MLKFSKYPLILAAISLIIGLGYYLYASQQAPKKVLESQQTIINIDSLRFTFKISIMSQKGLSNLRAALTQQNEELLTEAIDYYYVASGFTDQALINNSEFVDEVKPILQKIVHTIEHAGLQINAVQLREISQKTELISIKAEQQERDDWINIQQNYIDFNTHEYQVTQLFIALTITSAFFLLITIGFMARQAQLIKQNKQQSATLYQTAYFDSLTTIPNRKNIENRLSQHIHQAIQEQSSFFICLIDLDDFKKVNDLLGHVAGDELLKKTVSTLQSLIDQTDQIGRLGGDEFLIIFDRKTSYSQLIATLQRIQQAFDQPVKVANNEFKVTLSMGISSFPDDNLTRDNQNIEQFLIKSADIAMYESKNKGKNQYVFYDASLEEKIRHEHEMNIELARAINHDELELYYQPQIEAQSLKVVATEALIRWNHPEKGFIMPNDFIPFVEKGLHTAAFGEWVILNAIKQQQQWLTQGIDIEVSVNLSVKHVLSKHFYENITKIIHEYQVNLDKLCFEITEYELIQASDKALEDLKRLSQAGFKFHLDDFGTGYSSLSYLNELPITTIKIDKSFIDYIAPDHAKQNLVEAIIHIGDTLNKEVIAEGVETQYQVDFLQASGCEKLQGYYFSRPISAQQFTEFYQNQATTSSNS